MLAGVGLQRGLRARRGQAARWGEGARARRVRSRGAGGWSRGVAWRARVPTCPPGRAAARCPRSTSRVLCSPCSAAQIAVPRAVAALGPSEASSAPSRWRGAPLGPLGQRWRGAGGPPVLAASSARGDQQRAHSGHTGLACLFAPSALVLPAFRCGARPSTSEQGRGQKRRGRARHPRWRASTASVVGPTLSHPLLLPLSRSHTPAAAHACCARAVPPPY